MSIGNETLTIGPAPHVHSRSSVLSFNYTMIAALLPAVGGAVYFYGADSIRLIAATVVTALLAETIALKVRGRELTLNDGSAVITGIILALTLPPTIPTWMAVVGAAVGMILGKHVFGGYGYNPFNPALVGRVFLLSAFATHMNSFVTPFDGVSSATPLAMLESGQAVEYGALFLGNTAGAIGETSVLAILVGGLLLVARGYVDWRIPVGIIASAGVFLGLFGQDVLYNVLAGSLVFGAFFMATDPVTSPLTKQARWVYAIMIGFLVGVIRMWGSGTEGVAYSILFMNGIVPLLNRYMRPKRFGEAKTSGK